jgi:hypothetical protein
MKTATKANIGRILAAEARVKDLEASLKNEIAERFADNQRHKDECDRLRDEIRDAQQPDDDEAKRASKQGLDFIVTVEQNVNLRAERDALLLALVAAYKTRKPNG